MSLIGVATDYGEPSSHFHVVFLKYFSCLYYSLATCSDAGFKAVGSHCYHFADTATVSFTDAQAGCGAMGAKLASIHSEDEQDFIGCKLQYCFILR